MMLDQDAVRLARELSLPDEVVPIQVGAGCAGLARAAALAAQLSASNVLVITYNTPSRGTGDLKGGVSPLYRSNKVHPLGRRLWASTGKFSDCATACVLTRHPPDDDTDLYHRH